jgi:hypothetical protein
MLHLAFLIAAASVYGLPHGTPPICLAPPSAQFASTDATQASAAVNDLFTSYLAGPTLSVVQLTARLPSQARLEARQANCSLILFVTAKLGRRKSGGMLGQIAGRAAQEGVVSAGFDAARLGNGVTAAAARVAARAAADIAATTKAHDEMELSYRLELDSGAVLKEAKAKRRAAADGEDLLTPLVEHAAEEIAAVVTNGGR